MVARKGGKSTRPVFGMSWFEADSSPRLSIIIVPALIVGGPTTAPFLDALSDQNARHETNVYMVDFHPESRPNGTADWMARKGRTRKGGRNGRVYITMMPRGECREAQVRRARKEVDKLCESGRQSLSESKKCIKTRPRSMMIRDP